MTSRANEPAPRSGEVLDPVDAASRGWPGSGASWGRSGGGGRGAFWGRGAGGGPGAPWRRRAGAARFPWLGVLLVLLGIALLVRQVIPSVSFTGLLTLALGLAFGGAWLVGRQRWALIPALLLLALASSRLLRDVGALEGDGWTGVFLGVALLVVWGIGQAQRRRHGWALWLGALFVAIGLVQLSDRIPGLPDLGALWPLLVIGAGAALIVGSRIAARGTQE